MCQSGVDFNCPYSNRPSKPSTRLIGLTQSLLSGLSRCSHPYSDNWNLHQSTSSLTAIDGVVQDDTPGEYTRLRIKADSTSQLYNRAVLFHPNDSTFQASIVHRLGYQKWHRLSRRTHPPI
jgi:hypothetical protein